VPESQEAPYCFLKTGITEVDCQILGFVPGNTHVDWKVLGSRQISSAVSTVLRVQEFPVADAAVAEQCGYGDLR
jgi:hypothetical protein